MCPEGSISEPRVNVAAEFVRPLGLLFNESMYPLIKTSLRLISMELRYLISKEKLSQVDSRQKKRVHYAITGSGKGPVFHKPLEIPKPMMTSFTHVILARP